MIRRKTQKDDRRFEVEEFLTQSFNRRQAGKSHLRWWKLTHSKFMAHLCPMLFHKLRFTQVSTKNSQFCPHSPAHWLDMLLLTNTPFDGKIVEIFIWFQSFKLYKHIFQITGLSICSVIVFQSEIMVTLVGPGFWRPVQC